MSKTLTVIISNCLVIDLDELNALPAGRDIAKGIQKLLTYKNPKFTEAIKWGRSVYGIAQYLYSWEFSPNNRSLLISRGARKKVETYLTNFGVSPHYVDQTLVAPPVSFDQSKVVLREDQSKAIVDLLRVPFYQGILIAYTSFGKTLTLLEFARRIGQRTVVIVHTTFLQEQWIKEATNPKTFNLPMSEIGGVGGVFGGKKRKLGKLNVCLYHSLADEKHLDFFRPHIGLVLSDEVQKSPIDDIQKVVNLFPARYRFGASARIERKDGKEFLTLDTFGDIAHIAEEKNSASKILSHITIIPTGYIDIIPELPPDHSGPIPAKYQDSPVAILSRMGADKERNIMICKIAISKMRQGKLVIIFVERKEQAGYLMKMLSKFRGDMLIGPTAPDVVNDMDCPQSVKNILLNFDHEGAYDRITKLARHKELDFVIGTQKAEVGLSIRTLDVGIVTTPVGNNLERFNQIKGRLERAYGEEEEAFFGHKKIRPEIIVLKDKFRASRNSAQALKEAYGDDVTEIKRKTSSDNVTVIRRKED